MSTRKSESGNTARIQWCLSRTRTLLQQLARERDESLTNEAIDLSREALTLSSTESISFQVDAKLLLAFSLFIQFERSGEISLLDEGINIQREALDICPPDHPSRIELCENLGVHLTTRYKYTGDDGDAVAAIETQRETLGMRVKGHPDYAMTCTNLAYALKQRYQNTKDDSLMAESIDLERAALESWPVEHPRRATFYEKFAKSLWARYHTTGDVNLIDEAIYLQRASVSLVQRAEDPYLVTSRGILATFLGTKYTNSGEDNVLAEAIGLVHEVLRSQSPDDSEYTISCGNLANLLGMRYKHTGDVKYLEEAVDLLNKALDSCPLNDSRRLIACGNLAHALKLRYDHTGDDGFVAKAVELHREALALSVEPNTNRASICGELASLLTTRYRRTGDIGLLTESLHLHREGLALYPESHPHYPATCGNLANTLDVLYERTGDLSALEEALSLQRSAMQFCPPGDPQRPYIYHNLANSLRKRSERTGDSGDLVEAATLLRQVINLYPEEHPDRAKFCQALADVLKAIYTRRPDHMLMDEIHDLYRQGLALANIHSQHAVWRYACSLSWVYLHHESRFYNVAEAIRCIYKGLEHEIGDVGVAMPFILTCINNAWTRIDGSAMHTALISVYQRLLRFLPLVANTTLNIPDQVHALKACNGVGYDAFVSAVLADDYASGLEALEMAQGVLWSKYIHYRDPQLQDVPQHLAKELEELLHNHTTLVLTASSKDNLLTTRDVQHSHSARIYALIREIKALPGMDHFMSGDTFQNIRVVSSSHPAVVLVGARGFFYALVLSPETSTSSGHSIISLDLSESELESVYDLRGSERMQRGGPLLGAEDEEIDVNLDREGRGFRMKAPVSPWVHGLKFIWQKIVKPVIEHLGLQKPQHYSERLRLYWCPTGMFNNLPLHAAGLYDGPLSSRETCADYLVSSYTPTLSALLRAQRTTMDRSRESLSLALVAEQQALDPGLAVISGVNQEVEGVAALTEMYGIKKVSLLAGSTTTMNTRSAMKASNIVHLACHGVQDPDDATNSGFCLGDGRLTISQLMDLHVNDPFLAFLSACETAKGDKTQPDQAMHLAAAMLFCGYTSVVATMWAISDLDGPMVSQWFYEDLFSHQIIDSHAVAYALDAAVGKLRHSGVSFHRWAPFIHIGA